MELEINNRTIDGMYGMNNLPRNEAGEIDYDAPEVREAIIEDRIQRTGRPF